MTETAPSRVWVYIDPINGDDEARPTPFFDGTEYIRADAMAEAVEVIREIGRKAMSAMDSKTCCEIDKISLTFLTSQGAER